MGEPGTVAVDERAKTEPAGQRRPCQSGCHDANVAVAAKPAPNSERDAAHEESDHAARDMLVMRQQQKAHGRKQEAVDAALQPGATDGEENHIKENLDRYRPGRPVEAL